MLEVGEVNDIPVLMDFGSMGPARQEVKGMSDALWVQVNKSQSAHPCCCVAFESLS